MIVLLVILFLLGFANKLGLLKRLEKFLKPNDLIRDLFIIVLFLGGHLSGNSIELLALIGLPLSFFLLNFGKKNALETDILLSLLLLIYPAVYYLGLDDRVPVLASSLLAVFYCLKENYKSLIFGSVLISLFWYLNIQLGHPEVFSLFAPLALLLTVKQGMKSANEPVLEYSFLLISLGLVSQMESLPLWLNSSLAIFVLSLILFTKTSFKNAAAWGIVLLPLLYNDQTFARTFQLFAFLSLPIIYEIFSLCIQESKNFKVSGSNEVIMSYKQIVLILVVVLTLGGFRGTLFSVNFLSPLSFSYIIFLTLYFFGLPLKEKIVKRKETILEKKEEIYFLLRTISIFLAIVFSFENNSFAFNYFSLGLGVFFIGTGFVFRSQENLEKSLSDFLQKKEFSLGTYLKKEKRKSPTWGLVHAPEMHFEKWFGYNFSFEISLVFLALLLLVYMEGL